MTAKSNSKKAARLLQRRYNCSYQHALNLIRNHGFETAEARLKIEGYKAIDSVTEDK